MALKSLSIRWRLAAWIALSLLVTLLVIFFTMRFVLADALTGDLDDDLTFTTGQVSAQVKIIGSLEDRTRLQDVVELHSGAGARSALLIVIRGRGGTVRAATPGVNTQPLDLSQEHLQQVLAGRVLTEKVQFRDGEELRVRSSRLTVGQEVVGVLQVGASTTTVTRTVNQLQTVLLVEGLIAVIIVALVGYWLSRRALRPLERVTEVATEIQASDLSKRIEALEQPAEVQRLADTFDAMLERLDQAFQQQRNFVLDVSHELRTPLTALRGSIDVFLMGKDLDQEVRASLERMSGEVDRLIRLVSNLLYLAHADTGREPERRPFELDVVCLEVYLQAKDLRPDVAVRLGHEDQVTVDGDRDLIKQMVLNLVDNGIKYSPPRGKVTLSLHHDDGRARIVVEDTGPGISPEDLPQIFERFYRGNSASRRGSGGTGIGLAIARWIARSHGGDIEVESQLAKGTTFTVHLPLTPDPQQPGRS